MQVNTPYMDGMGKDIHGSYGVSFLEPITPFTLCPKKTSCPTKPSKELKGQLRGVLTDVSPKADFDRFKPLGFRAEDKKMARTHMNTGEMAGYIFRMGIDLFGSMRYRSWSQFPIVSAVNSEKVAQLWCLTYIYLHLVIYHKCTIIYPTSPEGC